MTIFSTYAYVAFETSGAVVMVSGQVVSTAEPERLGYPFWTLAGIATYDRAERP